MHRYADARRRRRRARSTRAAPAATARAPINVSTMAALIAAGAGARVVKHGNRAASSQCGSADVLEALGVAIDLGPDGVAALRRGGRHRVLLRAALPPGDALPRAGAQGARRADHVQLPRSAREPGARAAPGGRRVATTTMADADARRAARARHRAGDGVLTATTGSTSSPRRPRAPCTSWSTAICTTYTIDPLDLGIARADAAQLVRRRRDDERRDARARCSRARRARTATSRCSTRRRRWWSRASPPISRAGVEMAVASIDGGAAGARARHARARQRARNASPSGGRVDGAGAAVPRVRHEASARRRRTAIGVPVRGCGRTLKVPQQVPACGGARPGRPLPVHARSELDAASCPTRRRARPTVPRAAGPARAGARPAPERRPAGVAARSPCRGAGPVRAVDRRGPARVPDRVRAREGVRRAHDQPDRRRGARRGCSRFLPIARLLPFVALVTAGLVHGGVYGITRLPGPAARRRARNERRHAAQTSTRPSPLANSAAHGPSPVRSQRLTSTSSSASSRPAGRSRSGGVGMSARVVVVEDEAAVHELDATFGAVEHEPLCAPRSASIARWRRERTRERREPVARRARPPRTARLRPAACMRASSGVQQQRGSVVERAPHGVGELGVVVLVDLAAARARGHAELRGHARRPAAIAACLPMRRAAPPQRHRVFDRLAHAVRGRASTGTARGSTRRRRARRA